MPQVLLGDRARYAALGSIGLRVSSVPAPLALPTRWCDGYDGGSNMHCPFCKHPDSRVVDSREADEGQAIRRRRSCPECGRRFTTVETAVLAVVKRSGVTEPFSREKVVRGVRRACQGRDVDNDALNLLAQQVEDAVRASGSAEIPSNEVGLAILGPLRDLDEVAYLRFASVYKSFSSAEDFEKEIQDLRQQRQSAVTVD
ncbi:transcriptional repressor NrdR [Rhodococcus sp. UYP5]